MALTSGTKLGPYEIQSPLGAGGMGEVYRARDTRLDRTVAIKILPTHLSSNPEARIRFEREARTISSLNHPNICTLHDVGTQDSTSYLVMEYVEGETLQSRLQRGPLPLKQALECAMQICDALEKAHRAGIVHRDLKPGNIMLTASGAKLLDFGLAKPVVTLGAQVLSDKSNLTPSTPTVNLSALSAGPAALTQHGTVVGTFQYMAPEVLQGQDANPRSDIFSFGCVLYEMLTARRAFDGKSQLSVMTAILEKDPEPIAAILPTSPPALDYIVRICLEKIPDNRFQTAHDIKLQLAWIASASQTIAPVVSKPKVLSGLWVTGLAALALAALVAAVMLWSSRQPRQVFRANLLPPEGTQFETLYRNGPVTLSPDGRRIVFVARQDGKNSLWLRSLDKLEATPLRGTDEAFYPFWSPDGNSIAFFMQNKLWRMDLPNGSPVAICDTREPRGGTWGSGNVIVFASSIAGPLSQVSASGGTPRVATKTSPTAAEESDRWPSFLPDGKHFLFLHSPNGDADPHNELRIGSLDGSTEQIGLQGRLYTFQYADGWLFADRDGTLQAWRFDPSSGKVSGSSVQVVDKISSDDITAMGVFSVSSQGTLIYQQGTGATGDRHDWLDATGKKLSQISDPGVYSSIRISPDGTHVATPVLEQNGEMRLWVWDLTGSARARVTGASDFISDVPVWSVDGRTIFYASRDHTGHEQIRVVPADGSQPEQTFLNIDNDTEPDDTTTDGKWLLYQEGKKESQSEAALKAYPLSKGPEPFTLIDSISRASNARLKPQTNDWLVYQSNASGRAEVYLTRFPHPGAKYQVSQAGGIQPVWSKDGKKLFFLDSGQKINVVDITPTADSVQIGTPKALFQTGIRHSIPTEAYDVTRDGRFLVVNSVVESTAPVVLVTNWQDELKNK